jgi:hypothetical protein
MRRKESAMRWFLWAALLAALPMPAAESPNHVDGAPRHI